MAMPFLWGGGYRTSYSYWRAYSSKVKRGEVPCRAQRKPAGGLLPWFWSSLGHQAEVFWGTLAYVWPKGILWPLWSLPGDGHMCWPSTLRDQQNLRGLDWAERPLVCQSCIEEFAKGSSIFLPCVPCRITKGHGTKRDSSSQCTPLPHRIIILPMVWERSAELGDHR